MPRNRMIKPEFWSSEQVVACSVHARLLFIGMWNFADDAGNLAASPQRLKMEVFPGDRFTPSRLVGWLVELIEQGLVRQYESEGKPYWHITGFATHQRIRRPTFSHPPPPGDSVSPPGALQEPSRSPPPKAKEEKEEKEEKERNFDRSIDRSIEVSSDVKIDWATVITNCKRACEEIRSHSGWRDFHAPEPFVEVLLYAGAAVLVDLLPGRWFELAVLKMLEGKRKQKPAGWLGKVLAADALEIYGVDWDDWKRGVTLPKRKEPDK